MLGDVISSICKTSTFDAIGEKLHLVVEKNANNNFPAFPNFRQKLIDKIGVNRLLFMCKKTGQEAESAGKKCAFRRVERT